MKNTREHILKIALGLFLSDSYKGVTLSRIVEATGMSKGAFYHYFKSKELLFEALIEAYYEDLMVVDYSSCSEESLYQFSQDTLELVNRKAKAAEEFDYNILVDRNYIFLMIEGARHFPAFLKKLAEHQAGEIRAWTRVVSIARAKGEISSPMSDEQISKLFIAVTDGVGIRIIMANGSVGAMLEEIRSIWDGIYNQLKTR